VLGYEGVSEKGGENKVKHITPETIRLQRYKIYNIACRESQ
jgi:hypothetical protein